MEQILKGNQSVLNTLGKAKPSQNGYRLLHYHLSVQVDKGVLLLNLLTREMLLLSNDEYENVLELQYLKEKWFVVPNDTNEKQLVGSIRWVQKYFAPKIDTVSDYTIYTTTDCNARCFYCFEFGRKREPMSEETALKTAEFIKAHRGEKEVTLRWFGGEPLYNYKVIDLICESLAKDGIPYKSAHMITNGYLFDDHMVEKAINLWKLKKVQITLDGTEDVYNRCKAFIYKEGSAYQIVHSNIQRLLNCGIRVLIRVNMDFHNIANLHLLVDELAQRYGGKKGLYVYPRLIIDEKKAWDSRYSMEQWSQLYDEKEKLEKKLAEVGLSALSVQRVSSKLKLTSCQADNDDCLIVTPNGSLGVCEHHSDIGLIGHIDSESRDQAVIDEWRTLFDEIPECDTCFYYPECRRLKNCPHNMPCIAPERKSIRSRMEQAMLNEYRIWKKKVDPVNP